MTIKGGTSQACAVCKYQRRRCKKDCPLAPYFPADQQKVFQDAHRLFGVSNIMKILKEVHPDEHDEAMKSIKFESEMRAKFPVHGCLGVIWHLRLQELQIVEELRYVKAWLAFYRDQQVTPPQLEPSFPEDTVTLYHQSHLGMNGMPLQTNDFFNSTAPNVSYYTDHAAGNDMLKQNYNSNYNSSSGAVVGHCQMFLSQVCPDQQEMEVSHEDYDDIPLDAIADDRESYVDSKEASKSSAESCLRGTATQTNERVMENELKNAAAYFSLKSVKLN
ncbi:hypothetical protein K2173_014069 [Erythroxylum novogranatense]|uniref:LOB domain-containing protein n=1 Tax=Erythroxylum novogranatense TaxID=1862640 RepID=A0AAV8SDN6_9ROSI|nr:hypothetical protein K2173_014069 [Erythroxylum novogranatense]